MLGQHTDAIRSYRSGIASLCSPLAESTEKGDPLVETLMRNMNRALRFQIGSPKVSNPVKENVVPTVKHNQKLFSFLKKVWSSMVVIVYRQHCSHDIDMNE